MRKLCLLTVLILCWAAPAMGASAGQPETVELDELELSAPKDTTDRITQTEMERKSANTLWDALRGVSGVYQQYGDMRNEGSIAIRGSNRYQVGMYVDGVPMATAYRNEWDYNNTMTWDIESIEISKGYSSTLFPSSNSLAGVVNIRTAKPKKELEFGAKYLNSFDRYGDDQGRMFGMSLGTRQKLFYLQAQVIHDQQDFFTLSSDFSPGKWQDEGRRDNSDYSKKRLNVIGGFTPTENVDIMLGYVRQRFEKGQPVDASEGALDFGSSFNGNLRAWRWPKYETDRYYTNVDVKLGGNGNLRFVAYYDKHLDRSRLYDSIDFNTVADWNNSQTYDQYTAGGQAIADYNFNDMHKLAASAGYRRLSHKQYEYTGLGGAGVTNGFDWAKTEEATEDYYDLGLEYTFRPIKPLTLVLGFSYTRLEPDAQKNRDDSASPWENMGSMGDLKANLFTYQLGVFYDLDENHEVFLTMAHKERPATMRERYYKDNAGSPANPDIDPEAAEHFELGYRGTVAQRVKLNASAYYSHYRDKIQMMGTNPNRYFDNVDKADIYGLELGAEALLGELFSLGATASFMKWDTDTDISSQENLTDAPKAMGSVYAVINPLTGLSIIPELFMTSSFYNSSNPSAAHNKTPGFATINLKATYDVDNNLMLEAGIKNLLDKNYYYNYGFPHAGRSYFAGVTYKF